jgi:hypothetical protein
MEISVERSPNPSLPASVRMTDTSRATHSPSHSRTLVFQAQTTWSAQSPCQKQARMKCSCFRCLCQASCGVCPYSISFVSSRFWFHSSRHGLLYISIYFIFVLFSLPSVLALPLEVYVLSLVFCTQKTLPLPARSRPFQKFALC